MASWILAVLFLLPSACKPERPRVVGLALESVDPVDEAVADYTFRVVVKNPLVGDIHDVVATATPRDGAPTVVLDGESLLEDVPARSTVTSKDTVTVRHEGKDEYDGSDLLWQLTYTGGGPPPNQPPTASAGWPQTVQAGDLVQLTGSAGDPDGDPVTWLWSFVATPAGSNAQIVGWDTRLPTFVPDLAGTYQVQLVVSDGQLESAPSSVWITVLPLDPDPPAIDSVYPAPGATFVPTNAFLSAQFSEWLDASTVDGSSFTLVGPGGPVPASNVRASAGVALFYPLAPLAADTTYRATLAGTILDRQGQPLGADFVWEFSTGYEVDLVPPTVYGVTPPDGATGVVPTDPGAIEVEFDDTIDSTSLDGRITVSVAGGAAVNGLIQPVGGHRARFVPQLAPGQRFEDQTWIVTVWPGILDTSGNALQQATTWSFQTLPSHAPAWLSRPAGVGSPAETAAYYANLPIRTGCWWGGWDWGWECSGRGAPTDFWDFLWLLGWHASFEPRAVFYNRNDLAAGRDARCFTPGSPETPPGAPPFPDVEGADSPNDLSGESQVVCYAFNHGPLPGNPDHPDPDASLSEALSQTAPFSISAIFSRYDDPGPTGVKDVPEASGASVSVPLERGDVVTIGPATGSIWSGSLLYGSNGPNGIAGQTCVTTIFDSGPCPLEGGPLYGLLVSTPQVRLSNGTVVSGLRALGTSTLQFKALQGGSFHFRINDHQAGNGNGQFDVPFSVTRANAVQFLVYVPDGTGGFRLAQTATVDDEGPKQVPQACIACHGGTWDPDTQTVTGASLLPFDIGRVQLPTATGFTRADQEEPFRRLNVMVRATQANRVDPTSPIAEWIDGTYANRLLYTGQTADDGFVPPGWSGDAALYRDVAKPYCLTCHSSFRDGVDFDTAGEFRGFGGSIQSDVCVGRSMPHAGPTFEAFWQSGAAEILSQALFGGAHCGP